jgi:peptidyl-dipeptidase Dcp
MINTTPLFRCLMTPALVVSMTYAANVAAADAVTGTGDRVNPLLAASSLPNHLPRFDLIKDEDFLPAMKLGMRIERAEIAEIANNPASPTFENTIVAMERTGALLGRASRVFFNLRSADSNEARQAIEREVRPLLTAHNDAIRLDAALFARIDALYQQRASLGLSPTQLRLLEEYHRDFVRAGAALSEGEKARLRAINTELAQLGTEFSQNVLKEVQASALVVDSAEELAGLAPSLIEAAAAEAVERGLGGKYVLTLRNYSSQPGLSSLENRATREQLMRASLERGSRGGEFDNRETLVKIIALRAERAQLLGYETHADYVLEERTAKTVTAVQDMLGNLAPVAVANARRGRRGAAGHDQQDCR